MLIGILATYRSLRLAESATTLVIGKDNGLDGATEVYPY